MRLGPSNRALTSLAVHLLLAGAPSALLAADVLATETTTQAPSQPRASITQGFIGVAFQFQPADGALRGVRLSNGWVAEDPYKRGLLQRYEIDAWLSRSSTDEQAIWSAGLGAELPYELALGPLRAFPRGLLGIEYRTDEPDDGLAGMLGLGIVVEVWLGRHVSVSLALERRFSLPGDDRTQFSFDSRIASERIPALTLVD